MIGRVVTTIGALLVATAAFGQDWTAADNQELQAFTLTMARVQKADQVITSAYTALMADPARQAKIARRKAIESGEVEASEAEMEAMMREEQENDDSADSLADAVRQIEKEPAIASALRAVGMTAREYVLTQVALVQAGFAYYAQKQGLLKELPKEISAQHIAFVAEHEKEIEGYGKRWQEMSEALEEGD